jgi:exodeoxyribonuclease VII small subunit
MAENAPPKPKNDLTNALTFEKGLERLEKIVQELEKGELPLERSLDLFEEGMKLSGSCRKQLEEAESKVELLVKRAGKIVAEPFANGGDESGP